MASSTITCPVCTDTYPTAGPGGVLRHILTEHADSILAERLREAITDFWKAATA